MPASCRWGHGCHHPSQAQVPSAQTGPAALIGAESISYLDPVESDHIERGVISQPRCVFLLEKGLEVPNKQFKSSSVWLCQ